jgi:2'-5' RNA ligase
MKGYTVGIRVPGTSNKHLHMTICYLGELDSQQLQVVQKALDELATQVLPLPISFGDRDMFGADKTIPVRLVNIKDINKKKLLDEFYARFHKSEEGVEDHGYQNFHVTIKTIMAEESSLEDMNLSHMFMKQLGPHDPVWMKQIE